MDNNARTRSAMFMSLLDLVSCALGASIILAVVFAVIETPIPTPKTQDFLSAQFTADETVQLGVMLYHQQSNEFVLLTPETAHRKLSSEKIEKLRLAGHTTWYSHRSADNKGSVFSIYLEEPAKGNWLIAPYIYSYANNMSKQTVNNISVKWRHKHTNKDIECTEDVQNSGWQNSDKWSGSASGSLVDGVNGKLQIKDGECDKVFIAHQFI